jgi:hypothetical protein
MTARRSLLGSPRFKQRNSGTITTGSFAVFDFAKDPTQATPQPSQKYAPFNSATITNDSSYDIIAYVDGDLDNGVFIASGTIKTLDKLSLPAVRRFLVENLGSGSITANQLTFEVQKTVADTDSLVSGVLQSVNEWMTRAV